ncbi:MAG: hypothetical protein A3D13_02625 [Planctomycetes bacterium RIFCSPHIGHO2_02_FULL_40_12]|nr:MAG: hypothetical protein A3D13_02625 [Planctomycetes bacterium RIFCSPHIGHO2_02_FULL_40_12]OHC01272.1 MAG: hypothetical protein A3H23_03690 [Planctomycetes bacterium RIFCSPLOWO2_12_FULL_40_19]
MQAKKKYSDRRRNKRRYDLSPDPAFKISLPDQNRRHGDRRCDQRRRNVRLNLPFEVSLLDQDGKTMNVSASGVYFEVITNDTEAFSPGTIIPLQISTVTNTSGSRERKLKLSGSGTVIRNCIIENPGHVSSLRVALEFTEKLNIVLNND